jgi:Tol biopolymer transport system component
MRAIMFLAGAVVGSACTKPNPLYCDEVTPCMEGVCNLATHYCEEPADARGIDGAGPDAGSPCAIAGGLIVFATDRGGDYEIASMLADGTSFVELTTNTWLDELPQVSPDGSKIAWASSPAGQRELFVMNSDGTDPHNVSAGQVAQVFPRWSPDSTKLQFTTARDGNTEVYVVDANGSSLQNLSVHGATDTQGDWSPDGSRIMFVTAREGHPTSGGQQPNDIYVMDSDGTDPAPITTTDTYVYSAIRWSPAGTKLALRRAADLTNSLLGTMGVAGGPVTDIAGPPITGLEWSPDAALIAFSTGPDVFTITVNGASQTNLTDGAGSINASPRWSPNGSRLMFQSNRDSNTEIYAMNADGTEEVNLTNNPANDTSASWSICP